MCTDVGLQHSCNESRVAAKNTEARGTIFSPRLNLQWCVFTTEKDSLQMCCNYIRTLSLAHIHSRNGPGDGINLNSRDRLEKRVSRRPVDGVLM
jgi:hypothetical protein